MPMVDRRQWLQIAATASLAALGPEVRLLRAQAPAQQWQRKQLRIRGLNMSYYEAGEGDPIVFLHGNPTSSYVWRNIIPHVQHLGRCLAPDMIGMGDSDPLPDSGPGKYTFVANREYLFELFERLALGNRVTFVVHDWGSAIGFTWAQQYPRRVKGIAYMEAIFVPPGAPRPAPAPGSAFAIYRSPQGEQAVLQDNQFIESLISGLHYYLSEADKAEYRRPYLIPGESRRPLLAWPRQVPLGGEPKDVEEIVMGYSGWMAADADIPKLFVRAVPGARRPEEVAFVRGFKNQTEVSVYGAHEVQEVSPDAIGRALAEWIPTLS